MGKQSEPSDKLNPRPRTAGQQAALDAKNQYQNNETKPEQKAAAVEKQKAKYAANPKTDAQKAAINQRLERISKKGGWQS